MQACLFDLEEHPEFVIGSQCVEHELVVFLRFYRNPFSVFKIDDMQLLSLHSYGMPRPEPVRRLRAVVKSTFHCGKGRRQEVECYL